MMPTTSTVGTVQAVDRPLAALRRAAADAGIAKRDLFALSKAASDLPPPNIEPVLDRDDHDARVVAVSIMDFQARRPRLDPGRRRELYIRRHDRIDTWDLVASPT